MYFNDFRVNFLHFSLVFVLGFGDDVCTQVIIKLFMALNTLYLPIYLLSAVKCLTECEWIFCLSLSPLLFSLI